MRRAKSEGNKLTSSPATMLSGLQAASAAKKGCRQHVGEPWPPFSDSGLNSSEAEKSTGMSPGTVRNSQLKAWKPAKRRKKGGLLKNRQFSLTSVESSVIK
jgi:hypothetical protein